MADGYSIDDFDWGSGVGSAGGASSATSPEAPPEPAPAPAPARQSQPEEYPFDPERLPKSYQEDFKRRKGDLYKRGRKPSTQGYNIDDYDWGGAPVTAAPRDTYRPQDDWSITTGFKTGYQGGREAISTIGEMARIMQLPKEQQAQALIEHANKPQDPSRAKLQVEDFSQVEGVGDAWDFVMESIGQMGGSMAAAGVAGGLPMAAAGGAAGAAIGTGAGGVGMIPGAIGGAITAGTYGTMAAFGPMGVGGMFNDLVRDEGVKKGLADGTIDPTTIFTWAGLGGAAIGALDALSVGRLAKITGLTGASKEAIKSTYRKAIVKGMAKQAGVEGGTEALQGAISEFEQAVIGGDDDTANRLWSVINQGVVGAIGGAGAGGVGGVAENWRAKPAPVPPADLNQNFPIRYDDEVPPSNPPGGLTATGNPPPKGAGGPPATRRDYAADTEPGTGAGTTRVDDGQLDPDLAAGLGGELLTTPDEDAADFSGGTAPAAIRKKPVAKAPAVAVDVALALDAAKPAESAATTWTDVEPDKNAGPGPDTFKGVPDQWTLPGAGAVEQPAAAPAAEGEGGIRPWQEEFGPDPVVALAQMEPSDPRYTEVETWVNAQEQAKAYKGPAPAPLETPAAAQPAAGFKPEPPTVKVVTEQPSLESLVGADQAALAPVQPRPAKTVTRPSAVVLRAPAVAEVEEEVEEARPLVKRRLRMTPAEVAERRARDIGAAKEVKGEPGWSETQRAAYELLPTKTLLELFRKANPSLAKQPDAKLTDSAQFKDKTYMRPLIMAHLAEHGITEPAKVKGVSKEEGGRKATREHLTNLLSRARRERRPLVARHAKTFRKVGEITGLTAKGQVKLGKKTMDVEELFDTYAVDIADEVQPAPLKATRETVRPIRKTARDLAIETLRKHFARGKKPKPVKLAPLNFTEEEIAAFERVGFAEDGSMDAAEFARWQGSSKGLTVPEGIAPQRPAPAPKKEYKYPKREDYLSPDEVAEARFKAAQEAKEKAPYVRTVRPYGVPAEKKLTFKAERARKVAIEGEQKTLPKRKVAVHAKSEKQQPATKEIPTGPGFKARIIKAKAHEKAKRVNVPKVQQVTEEKGPPTRTSQLEQELAARLRSLLATDSHTLVEEAAARGAKSQEARAWKALIPPLQLARERIEAALKIAIAAFEKGRKDALRKELQDQIALHDERQKIWRAEEALKVRRTSPVTGKKASKSIAEETDQTTRRRAAEERKKHPQLQDKLLIAAGDLLDLIKGAGKQKKYADAKVLWERDLKEVQQKRAEMRAVEEAEIAKARAAYDDAKLEQEVKLQAHVREWVAAGEYTEADVEEFQLSRSVAEQNVKRKDRVAKTTPIIQQTLAKSRLPVDKSKRKVSTPAQDHAMVDAIAAWAPRWVVATRDALHKAGIDVSHKISTRWNSAEENVLIYVENLLSERKKVYTKGEAYKKGVKYTAQRISDRVARLGFKEGGHRGQGAMDAWVAARLIQPVDPKGKTEAQIALQRRKNEELLKGVILDASKTASTAADPQGLTVEQLEADEATADVRPGKAVETRQEVDDKFKAQLKRYQRSRGWGAAEEMDPDELPLGKRPDTMSATEALNRHAKGTQGLTGWRKLVRRALLKTLKSMVGDVPVHFVDGAVLASFEEGGKQRAGMFVREKGKSFILMHENTLNRPGLLAETLVHELVHAATAHAIDNNIRGTRDIIRKLMNELTRTLGDVEVLPNKQAYSFENEHEFLTAALQREDMQAILSSLSPSTRVRAQVRALGRGRPMPTFWDVMVAAVQNAIGLFTPGRAGTSYMDQLLRLYPHVAMSSAEQQADAAIRLKGKDIETLSLGSPFDMGGMNKSLTNAKLAVEDKFRHRLQSLNSIRQGMADIFGTFTNPGNALASLFENHQRLVELEMQESLQKDDELRRWMMEDEVTRRPLMAEGHDVVVNASLDRVDPRLTLAENTWIWDDANHPTKTPRTGPTQRHLAAAGQREAHPRYKARWDALPADLQTLLSDRVDIMKKMMAKYETTMVRGMIDRLIDAKGSKYILPPGMSRPDAVKEIMDDKISPELKAVLGRHADTIGAIGRFGLRGGMYAPASRAGQFFISGRVNIATPTARRGTVLFDDEAQTEKGIFRFVFDNAQDASDYIAEMGRTGDDRVLKFQPKHIDPRDGTFVPHDFHEIDNGVDVFAQPVFYVTMQDRFMAMSDDFAALEEQVKQLRASGDFSHVEDPILMHDRRTIGSTMPLQLQAIINNIDGQTGVDEKDKANAIQMVTNHFIRTQQGNRITKRMLKRQGVAGFEVGSDELFKSFHSNSEMMARHIVAQTRIPAIAKANQAFSLFIDAMKSGRPEDIVKLPVEQRDIINREYGKADRNERTANKLAAYQKEINSRIEDSMQPTIVSGENLSNAVQSATTLNYLGNTAYFAMQTLSLGMFTLPNMSAEFSKLDGVAGITRAGRYLKSGLADVGVGSSLWRGLTEAAAEGKQWLGGFKPRPDGHGGRPMRRSFDYKADLKDKLDTNGARNASVKKKALDIAWLRNVFGQAGLDQPNVRMDLQTDKLRNKFFRGLEQTTRIFRAIQEGIENVNRAAPLFAYIDYYLDKGLSEDEAIERAIANMSKEQVSYAKSNRPTWMAGEWAKNALTFRWFAMQQGFSFYDSLRKVIDPRDREAQRAALIHVTTMSVMLGLVGGLVGNPLWEPFKYLMYLLTGSDWDELKTNGETWLAGVTGTTAAEAIMYGPSRLVGLDLSGRAALNTMLFYDDPEEMNQDEWLKIIGSSVVGATGSMVFNAAGMLHGLFDAEQRWPPYLAKLPIPDVAKDILKTYDVMANGPTTTSGIKTGEPPGILGGIVQALGFRTSEQARPFEMGSAAQHRADVRARDEKAALVRQIIASGGMTRANMRRINDWNRLHPEKEMRISTKNIMGARKRRAEIEQEIEEQNEEAY